jgi:hypothetical protein
LLSRSKLIQRLSEVTHRLLYFEECRKSSNLANFNLGLSTDFLAIGSLERRRRRRSELLLLL